MSRIRKTARNNFKFPVIIYDDMDTHVGYIMDPAINSKPETVNFMIKKAKGLVYVCITKERAKQLGLPLMNDNSSVETRKDFTVSVDYKTTTTGISAFERTDTIRAFLDDSTSANDFRRPGHIFPLISRSNGLLERKGITEAAITFAQLTLNESVAYLCEILNSHGEVAERGEIEALSQEYGLEIIPISQIVNMQLERTNWLELKLGTHIDNYPNISVYEIENKLFSTRFSVYVSTSGSGLDRIVHYTECTSGDLLGQDHCNCDHHFKDYFDMLTKGEINAIVLHRDQSLVSAKKEDKHLIKLQIRELIKKVMQSNRKPSKNERVIVC